MWIKNRIDAEYKKHYRVTGGCDWSRIAEAKINAVLNDKVKKLKYMLCKDCGRIPTADIIDKIDKIMGSFNHSPTADGGSRKQQLTLPSGDAEDNHAQEKKGCGNWFITSEGFKCKCGKHNYYNPDDELCPKCQEKRRLKNGKKIK